jgi:signal transduction histidine kinase
MSKPKILIVEDESITAFDLQVRLEAKGYSVPAIVSSGDEAIRITETLQPDLILMDIRIRGEMDGIETAKAIRERFDIPIIYLTAFADDATIERARYTQAFGYLLKPFQEQELYSSVEMALYKHKAERELRENERRLQILSERLQTLHSIEQAILGADSPVDISQAVLRSIEQLIPCETALVMTIDSQCKTASILASHTQDQHQVDAFDLRINDTEYSRVIRVNNNLVVTQSVLLKAIPDLSQVLRDKDGIQYTIVPLLSQDEVIGVLVLGTLASQLYEDSQLDIIRELANSLALAIHHSRLNVELEKYSEELTQRNEDLDAFAHTVAHDMKSPIGVIAGYCGILSEDIQTAPRDDLRKYIDVISRTTEQMNDIVNELLLLAEIRIQDVHRELLDMSEIVEKARSRLNYQITKKAAEMYLPEYWPPAYGYGPWVEEVWVNYINNALKYGGNPPKIWFGVDEQIDANTGILSYRFWIRDNGNGIPPGEQAELFTPFTRMRQVRAKGHGLGLSIVHRIIEKLGGCVGMESDGNAGQGCLFYFTLPAGYIEG